MKLDGPVPGPDLDRGRRPRDRQRPQRGLRRQLRGGLRRTRATASSRRSAPSSARSAWSRRPSSTASTRLPSLFHEAGHSRREPAPEHDSRLDPGRPRARGERDRAGPGAGDAAADGLGGPDDRRRRRAEPHSDRLRSPAAADGGARAGDLRGRSATTVRNLMVRVVSSGTGAAAALPGVQVAGKTGTAELGPKPLRARPASGFRRGARAEGRRLVHRLRPGKRPEARGGGHGRRRRRRRRHRGGADRSRGARGGPRRRLKRRGPGPGEMSSSTSPARRPTTGCRGPAACPRSRPRRSGTAPSPPGSARWRRSTRAPVAARCPAPCPRARARTGCRWGSGRNSVPSVSTTVNSAGTLLGRVGRRSRSA